MKKLILLILLLNLSFKTYAALPKGVTNLDGRQAPFYSFMYEDSHKRIWVGFSRLISNSYRSGPGYGYYDSAYNFHRKSQLGIYSDAIEFNNEVFIALSDGLFRYFEDTVTFHPEFADATEFSVYKDSLFVGTVGHGLKIWKNGKVFSRQIKVNNVVYDTVMSISSFGNALWIGTSRGVVKYENGSFSLFQLPAEKINPNKYNYIKSVVADGNGNIWCLNDILADTVSNIYIMLKGTSQWIPADNFYRDQCLENRLIPNSINRLFKARNGSILIGTYYGLIELTETTIHCFPVIDDRQIYNYNVELLRYQSPYYAAMEDKNGNYFCLNIDGFYKIDRKQYDFISFSNTIDNNHSHAFSSMDLNDIHAGVANDGTLFNGSDMFYKMLSGKTFTMPALKCTELLFNSTVWFAGHGANDDSRRTSVIQYRQVGSDFAPGPVSDDNPVFDSAISARYNKIWRMDKEMVDEFKARHNDPNYIIPQAILDWPGNNLPGNKEQLAPYADVDGNGIYDPTKGDYPMIKGDRMLWWVFNDFVDHSESGEQPIGLQINASCYAFRNVKLNPSDSQYIINRTIFFNYVVIHKSFNSYDNIKMGIFVDPDIGNYTDDEVSCDSTNSIAYAYNADNFDEGRFALGKNPPLITCKFLNKKMQGFIRNSSYTGVSGYQSKEFYALLNNSYILGDSIHTFPEKYQSVYAPCQANNFNAPSESRFLMVTSLDNHVPGSLDFLEWSYSVLYDPNTDYLTQNCNEPLNKMLMLQRWYNTSTFPSEANWNSDVNSIHTFDLKIYPNPASDFVHLVSGEEMIKVVLMDVSGKEIMSVEPGSAELTLPLPGLQTGVYLLKIVTRYGTRMEKLLVH